MKTPTRQIPLFAAVLFAAAAGTASAEGPREAYTYLSFVGPEVSLASKAEDDQTARVNMPVLAGDQLTTGTSSRAEAVFASGAIVRIDGRSDVRFERLSHTYESEDDRDLLTMSRGALSIELREAPGRDHPFRVDTDDATVVLTGRGIFRVDAGRRGTEVYAANGSADVNGRGGRVTLKSGQYAWVSGSDEIEVENADLPRDRFTRFVAERRDRGDRPRGSVSYVSSDYDYEYGDAGLEDNGSWVYVSAYNRYCWRPSVAADWAPYSQGYWRWTPAGLTWVSYESWGWLPYHYGTWAFDESFGWCWLPDSFYSPAWVYWNYTPGWVGWCPIGTYGYHDAYYRSTRLWAGAHQPYYPYLRGRVDVKQIDPRGWNYVAVGRVGARLAPAGDILRADRVGFRPGDMGILGSSPLRVERGSGPATVAVQDALRKMHGEATGPRGGAPALGDGLVGLLRRDRNLSPGALDELRRASVTASRGPDNPFRPLPPDAIASSRRLESPRRFESGYGGDVRGSTWREAGASRRSGDTPLRREGATSPRDAGSPRVMRGDDGWRSPTSPSPRPIEPRGNGRVIREGSGWRAGGAIRSNDSPPRREAPPASRDVSPPSAPRNVSPQPAAPAPAPRPAPAGDAPRRQSSLSHRAPTTYIASAARSSSSSRGSHRR